MNKQIQQWLLPCSIIAITVTGLWFITQNQPSNYRVAAEQAPQMSVQIQVLTPTTFQIELSSFGTVKPRTQSVLTAQVTGQIVYISEQFRDGGFFELGEVLVSVDDRDYQAELKIAQAAVLSAEQQLLEEQAKANQATEDWQRLGNGATASPLVLREPQLAAAQAQMLSAQAKMDKAKLALERTKIVAPFAGRVLKKRVDVGQVVSANSALADIYASDYVEIRLPINNSDLQYVDLPEQFRDRALSESALDVSFKSAANDAQVWQGKVIRTEGSIDSNSQQLYVVAQIDDPFAQSSIQGNGTLGLKIGQYLSAKIQGKLMTNAMIIPNSAIYQASYVFIEQDQILQRKEISIAWQNAQYALVSTGLSFNQHLVLTPLGQVSSGTKVAILGENSRSSSNSSMLSKQQKHQGSKQ